MSQATFWNLTKTSSTGRRRAEWADDEMGDDIWGEPEICPREGPLGGVTRVKDLSVILPGRSVEDIVWTWHTECLLTDRAYDLLKASGFTGFETKPVKAVFKRPGQQAPRLRELIVTGSGGVAPPEAGIRVTFECPACGRKKYSDCTNPARLVDVSQWDGSDFFTVAPFIGYILVTDRVAQAIRSNKIRGAVLKRLRDLDVL